MSGRTATWIAWSVGLYLLLTEFAVIILETQNRPTQAVGILINVVLAIPIQVVGPLLGARLPRNPLGWIFCACAGLVNTATVARDAGIYVAATTPGRLPVGVVLAWVYTWMGPLGLSLLVFLFLLFPTGRLPTRRWRSVAWLTGGAILLFSLASALKPGPLDPLLFSLRNPFGVESAAALIQALWSGSAALLFALGIAAVASVLLRFRQARGEQRQQLKWFVYAAALVLLLIAINTLLGYNADYRVGTPDPALALISFVFWGLSGAALPTAIGIAVLRYRLWDIDLLINRTLVYGTLTASVIGLYVLVVGGLGALLQTGGNVIISLVATGLVAILFQPLRAQLQRGVNRLLYGERDEPYAVLTRLGQRLEANLAPAAVLPTIVETIAQALKLPYVAVLLWDEDALKPAASYGQPQGEPLILPLVYQGETLGALQLAPRPAQESFTPADLRFLTGLIHQVSLAAQAVRLTTDLQRANAHLLAARARLVAAREEERRRLRRDLHDGLGPTLGALTLKIGAARRLLVRDPAAAEALLQELNQDIETTVGDIRRLVAGLRPPALDELGLLGALRDYAVRSSRSDAVAGRAGLHVVVEAPECLPPLPAAVEVAAYRIAQEAVTNVVRHARAGRCSVGLTLNGALGLDIRDDGQGLPAERRAGVGIRSMQERAAELGGTCVVEPVPTGGTRVLARLPLAQAGEATGGGEA